MSLAQQKVLKRLKIAVWAYLLLAIFEGALRKWVLPSLSDAILIIRDPIALYLLMVSRARGFLTFNPYTFWMVLIGIIGTITAVLLGHGSMPVAIYGARIFLIHFPVMFTMGRIFTIDDVIKYGKAILWITIPMTFLIILQFYSPQSAWVNRGVGGDTSGAGFSGALGYFRPPGTFSFTNGNSLFYGLAAAYIFYFWFNSFLINKIILIAATVCLLLSIPFSISRTLFFEVITSVLFMIIALWNNPYYLKRIMLGILIFLVAYLILKDMSFFSTGTEVFSARFESANETDHGVNGLITDRFLGGMVGAIQYAPNLPFFGYGLGMGTNVGASLLTGERGFLVAEQDWGRVIGELGLLMGFIVIFVRISFSLSMVRKGIRELRNNNPLPWMLLSFAFLQILQGGWAQPTSLGFSALSGGLVLASMNSVNFKFRK